MLISVHVHLPYLLAVTYRWTFHSNQLVSALGALYVQGFALPHTTVSFLSVFLSNNSVHSSAHGFTSPMLPIIVRGMYQVHGFDATV
jgi:hypothetical protein